MQAIGFKETSNRYFKFEYELSDLKVWLARGRNYGDSGPILLEWNNGIAKYKSFGTIEDPIKDLMLIDVEWCESFDGKFKPECYLKSYTTKETCSVSFRYDIV